MDINNWSLEYFNTKGIDLIFGKILGGLELSLEYNDFVGHKKLKKDIEKQIKKMKSVQFVKMPVLIEVVDWLNKYNQMDAFGTEGWEHSFGLE